MDRKQNCNWESACILKFCDSFYIAAVSNQIWFISINYQIGLIFQLMLKHSYNPRWSGQRYSQSLYYENDDIFSFSLSWIQIHFKASKGLLHISIIFHCFLHRLMSHVLI